MATYIGTGGKDVIRGSKYDDIMFGGDGDDHLFGLDGNDLIFGGNGRDYLHGNDGDDELHGEAGDDMLHGGAGDDVLVGGAGDDYLHGGDGIDTAVYYGSILDYSFLRSGGVVWVTANAGDEGTDQLVLVERMVFADATIDLTQNNAPITFADLVAIDEDAGTYSSGGASVLDNDFDFEGDAMSVTPGVFNGTYGQLTLNANGTYSYVLHASAQSLALGDVVQDSFTYVASDGSLSSNGTLVFTISGLNDAPVAADDTAGGQENETLVIDVLANDSDVDNGAVLTVVAVSGPAGKGSVSIVGNQLVFDPGADFDRLALGASEVVMIDYTIEDEHGAQSSASVAITVTGTNDGPVAVADAAAGHENEVLTIDVLANDSDVDDGAVLTIVAASAPKGTVGIVAGQLVFDPGTAFDHLAAGASEVVVLSYTIEDEHGAQASSTVTVTVTGTNDGPVAVADTATGHENQLLMIDVLANDHDVDDGSSLSLVAASVSPGQGSVSIVGGQVRFDPGADFDYLAVGESASVSIAYTIEDEHGAQGSSTATVTVTGTNDAPDIVAGGTTATGSVTELDDSDPAENAYLHQASGTIAFADPDLSDTHGATFTAQGGSYVGSFSLGTVDQSGNMVGWSFSVEDSDIDFLAEGQVLVQTYTVQISDGNGGTASQDVTVTITGKSDNLPPDAVNDSYAAIGNVVLTVNAANGVLANDQEFAGGTIGTGPGGTPVTAYDSVSANGGSVTMNPDGSFSYVSAAGFQGVDTFTYTITDPEGEADTATVTVNVAGSVWFIDNSAVGSANTGTQADPFTSLAAFNAAQGTANGPAAGETIYLRQGTGTYAEADGINLLDGQTLVGGAQNLVVGGNIVEAAHGRPTIVTTGAGNHGVELAQNNSVSGLHVGSTTGAGIADGNGSVGNLTVFDVSITGAGQIVDIDQGGTLNVTLGYVQSTGSSGGAIDLNGVSGSFTTTGFASIMGAHSGGGIDITNSSLTFTISAGGMVQNTVAGHGVRFEGNSGHFAVTGGYFDLVTHNGDGFVVQNGGTVAMSGFSNNIAAYGGSAVIIRNASTGGVTLESVVSTSGAGNGIILENAGSGGFTITGLNGAAVSGGAISKSGADGSMTTGSAISIVNTSNVSLSHMSLGHSSNYGIVGVDVQNFTLKDSTVFINGSNLGLNEGGVHFTNLTGTALFEGNNFHGNRADNLRIENNSGHLDLTIQDSALNQAVFGNNHLAGADSVHVRTGGSASLTMLVDGVDFNGAFADLLQVVALGNSTQDLTIRDSNFHNSHPFTAAGAGGVVLNGGGAGSNIGVDVRLEGNSFQGAEGNALTLAYTQAAGAVRGYIAGNVIGVGDGIAGSQGSAGSGAGISVTLEKAAGPGSAGLSVNLVDNEIYDVAGGLAAVVLRSSGGGAANPAVFEATLTNNIVAETGAFAALYALVGGSDFMGDYARMGLAMNDNLFDLGDADFAGNAVFLDQVSMDANFYLPGYTGSPDGEYMGGTASDDIHAYLAARGNVMVNGIYESFPGGVDAGIVMGVTGDALTIPVWFA